MHQQQKQDQEEEEIDTSTVMVYASRMRGQLGRSRCFLWFLLFLMPADACIVLTIMIQAAMNDTLTTIDGAIFVLTLLALVMAHVGTRTLDSRLMTIFETVYYIDALINLFRVENRLQFAHFGIQLVICHCVGGFKTSIAGQWFSPR
jgi:hypothetical protein